MKHSISTRAPGTRRLLPLVLAALAVGTIVPAAGLSAADGKKPPPPAAAKGGTTLTLAASSLQVVFGTATTLSGVSSTKQAGESVTILAQRYGEPKLVQVAMVTTTAGGAWSYRAKPTIGTSYRAEMKKATSPTLAVGVRPLGAFHVLTGNRFSTKLTAARSFAGKTVQLQRRSSLGQWVTLKRMQLGSGSGSIFRPALPMGSSSLRVAMSVNQAGPGYLAGISRTIVFHRN
jgi:hypothetical protein